MVVMPMPIFLVGSDLAPLEQRMDQVSAGLTAWQPTIKDTGVQTPPPVTIDANGYESAFDQFNRMCLASNWGDITLFYRGARPVDLARCADRDGGIAR